MNKLLIVAVLLSTALQAKEITNTGFEAVAEEHVLFVELTRSKDRASAVLTTICNHNLGGGVSCNVDYFDNGDTSKHYIETFKLVCDDIGCTKQ